MIVQAALVMAVQILKQAKVEDPVRDARVLMAACLDIPFGRLTLHAHDEFEDAPEAAFFADIGQRAARTPVSHLPQRRSRAGRHDRARNAFARCISFLPSHAHVQSSGVRVVHEPI